jgi:Cu/Ag efflux pump CusA
VVALAALLLVFGFARLEPQPVDVLPEFSRPYVEIQAEALGLSAEEVEAMITTPLEADMLNGTPWVEEIRSTSIPGLSSIVLVFEQGTDIMRARQVSQERLTEIFTLPGVSKPPVMINPVSSTSRFMAIGLTSDTLSLIDMSVLARWTIVPRLMGLPSVANASIWGERKWQLQVQVNPERLRDERVTLQQVIATAGNALWASPLTFLEASTPGTGGWIETPNQRLGVRHILPIQQAADLAAVTIVDNPSKRLGDVATVVEDHQPLIGDALIDDEPALMLVVEKFPWADTTDATAEVEAALSALRPGLDGLQMDSTLFRQASYLELADDNVSATILVAASLVVLGFFAFFLNWRAALIATVAAVLSVVAGGTVLYLQGVTTNFIIIAGFMMALGVVIDDVIVDIAHVRQHLRRARDERSAKSSAVLVFEAVAETRSTLLYATVILMLAVMPLMVLEGVTGSFFQPLATSYVVALAASFAVALTVTPALSLLLLGGEVTRDGGAEAPAVGLLRRAYRALFGWAADAPVPALVGVGVLVVAGLTSVMFLRQESLLPDFKETDLVVRLVGSASASHPAMSRITTAVSRELRVIPGVRKVSAHVGRAIASDKRNNINAAELWVNIDPAVDYDATVAAVREVVAGYRSLSPEVLTYLQARLREELSGTENSLVVRVYGDDLNVIRSKAEEVEGLLSQIGGITAAQVEYPRDLPTLQIEVDIERAKEHGLTPGDVRRAATALVSGIEVGSLFEEQKVFEVVVYGTPETRHSVTSVENLLIDTPGGGHVSMKDVASVQITPTAAEIHRDAVARRIDVTADVQGRDLGAVAADVEAAIQQVQFPLEYRAELLGEYAVRRAAQQRVLAFAAAAAIGILLVMQAFFRSWTLAAVAFLSLPAALAGGLLATLASGGVLSFGSLLGLVTVLGLAVRNVLTLVSRYRHLQQQEGWSLGAAVLRGTEERAAPILMTALGTALLFLPFAVRGAIAGLEILQPMAVVVLGGLVSTTLLSLAGVPAMYLIGGGAAAVEPDFDLMEEVPDTVVTV